MLIPYCLDYGVNKAIRPASGILRGNGRSRGGHSFALFLLKSRQLRRQSCRLMTAFHVRRIVWQWTRPQGFGGGGRAKKKKRLIKAKRWHWHGKRREGRKLQTNVFAWCAFFQCNHPAPCSPDCTRSTQKYTTRPLHPDNTTFGAQVCPKPRTDTGYDPSA